MSDERFLTEAEMQELRLAVGAPVGTPERYLRGGMGQALADMARLLTHIEAMHEYSMNMATAALAPNDDLAEIRAEVKRSHVVLAGPDGVIPYTNEQKLLAHIDALNKRDEAAKQLADAWVYMRDHWKLRGFSGQAAMIDAVNEALEAYLNANRPGMEPER